MEVLVRTIDNTNPTKDHLCYKAGDPVLSMPDGHTWGRMESLRQWVSEGNREADWPGGFLIVKVPGIDPSLAAPYLEEGATRRIYQLKSIVPDEFNEKTITNISQAMRRK